MFAVFRQLFSILHQWHFILLIDGRTVRFSRSLNEAKIHVRGFHSLFHSLRNREKNETAAFACYLPALEDGRRAAVFDFNHQCIIIHKS